MNFKQGSKAKVYITLLLALVLVLLASTFFLMERCLRGTSNTTLQLENLYVKSNQLQTLKLLLEKKRNYTTNLSSHNYDEEQFEKQKEQLSEAIDAFIMNLNKYDEYANEFSMSNQESAILGNLKVLFNQYNSFLMEMIVVAGVNDTEAVEILLSEAEPISKHLNAYIEEMQDYTQALFYETSFAIDRNVSYTITLLAMIFATIFAIIIIIGVMVRRKITSPADSVPERTQTSHISNEDTALLFEMRKCVSDLKAVAYDLSKSSEDIKK